MDKIKAFFQRAQEKVYHNFVWVVKNYPYTAVVLLLIGACLLGLVQWGL